MLGFSRSSFSRRTLSVFGSEARLRRLSYKKDMQKVGNIALLYIHVLKSIESQAFASIRKTRKKITSLSSENTLRGVPSIRSRQLWLSLYLTKDHCSPSDTYSSWEKQRETCILFYFFHKICFSCKQILLREILKASLRLRDLLNKQITITTSQLCRDPLM